MMSGEHGVTGIGFVGMRTDQFAETVALFVEVIGADVVKRDADQVSFKLADGTLFELYVPANEFHAFFQTGAVVGFRVAAFGATKARMFAAGVSFIGEPQHAEGLSWQHFRCPDGTVAEIIGPGAPE